MFRLLYISMVGETVFLFNPLVPNVLILIGRYSTSVTPVHMHLLILLIILSKCHPFSFDFLCSCLLYGLASACSEITLKSCVLCNTHTLALSL